MKVLMMKNLFLETVCIWTLLCFAFRTFPFLFNLLFTPVTGGNWGQLHFFAVPQMSYFEIVFSVLTGILCIFLL
jgi:hypothetical protein